MRRTLYHETPSGRFLFTQSVSSDAGLKHGNQSCGCVTVTRYLMSELSSSEGIIFVYRREIPCSCPIKARRSWTWFDGSVWKWRSWWSHLRIGWFWISAVSLFHCFGALDACLQGRMPSTGGVVLGIGRYRSLIAFAFRIIYPNEEISIESIQSLPLLFFSAPHWD